MTDAASTNLGPARGPLDYLDASAPVGRLLEQTTAAFEATGMPLARRWAETLVAAVLDVPHVELRVHAGRTLGPEQRRRFEGIVRGASPEVPLAYAVGRAPFLAWTSRTRPTRSSPRSTRSCSSARCSTSSSTPPSAAGAPPRARRWRGRARPAPAHPGICRRLPDPGGRLFLEHEWYHGEGALALAERQRGRYEDVRTLKDANRKDRALNACRPERPSEEVGYDRRT